MQVATRARAGEQLDRDVGEAITVRMEQQGVGEAARQRLQMAMLDGELADEDKKLLIKFVPKSKAVQLGLISEVLLLYAGQLKTLFNAYCTEGMEDLGMSFERALDLIEECGVTNEWCRSSLWRDCCTLRRTRPSGHWEFP